MNKCENLSSILIMSFPATIDKPLYRFVLVLAKAGLDIGNWAP